MENLEEFSLHKKKDISQPVYVDAKGSQCPGPVVTLKDHFKDVAIGQKLIIESTDPGFRSDIVAWCNVTGNTLIELITENDNIIKATILKNKELGTLETPGKNDEMTIIVFSEEMDKGFAAFNIALGALSMGIKVNMFFTFWGLSLIKKPSVSASDKGNGTDPGKKSDNKPSMLPKDDESLPLSHDNPTGTGSKMMEQIMASKNIPSLDFMIHLAKYEGVKFTACQMSMEVLGITKEDLIDGVGLAGVASMIEDARKSNINYFI